MDSVSELQVDLIKLIASIRDARQLKIIHQTIESIETEADKKFTDKFEWGKTEVKKGWSKSDVFEEQAKSPVTFAEVQSILGEEPCEESLEELLASLD